MLHNIKDLLTPIETSNIDIYLDESGAYWIELRRVWQFSISLPGVVVFVVVVVVAALLSLLFHQQHIIASREGSVG